VTQVRRIDAVTLLRSDAVAVTAEGFRLYDALFARSGLQVYGDSVEYRPDSEVFASESLASYELRPLTDLHPPGNVSMDSARVHARGAVSPGRRHTDGRHVAGRLAVWDAELAAKFDAAEKRGAPMQLSAGYTLDLDPTPGVFEGKRYDAIQRSIRINHVAAVPLGRAGSAQVITDAADLVGAWDLGFAKRLDDVPKTKTSRVFVDLGPSWSRRDAADLRTQTPKEISTMKIQTNVDGRTVEIEVADGATQQQIADAVAKVHADALAKFKADAMAPPFTKKGEKPEDEDEEMADKKKADSAREDERLEQIRRDSAERVDVLSRARVILGLGYEPGDRSNTVIKLDTIERVLGADERKAIESLPKHDQAGATAYAFRRAASTYQDRSDTRHADGLLESIDRVLTSRADDKAGKREDTYTKAKADAEARARNPQKVS
jgi:hypothetical protein